MIKTVLPASCVPLVVLDIDKDALLIGRLDQRQMVVERLGRRLGDEDVDPALDRVQRDGEVRRVGREDGDGVAGLQRVDRRLVGRGVAHIAAGECLERYVQPVVDVADVLFEVVSCGRVSTGHIYIDAYGYVVRLRIAGNLEPFVPTMLRSPTFPRRRRSNNVRPTTPTWSYTSSQSVSQSIGPPFSNAHIYTHLLVGLGTAGSSPPGGVLPRTDLQRYGQYVYVATGRTVCIRTINTLTGAMAACRFGQRNIYNGVWMRASTSGAVFLTGEGQQRPYLLAPP